MTQADALAPHVRRFVYEHLDNVEQLDVLLALLRERARSWTAADVAESLNLSELMATTCLEQLARAGVLDVRISSDVIYRFGPATPEISSVVHDVAKAYATCRSALLALVSSPRHRALKDFSNAFRVRRDPDNG